MKTNLSSQITLTRIPTRYYRPENAYEQSVLTRFEKIPTVIYESADEGSLAIAAEIAAEIRKKQETGQSFVLALPGGRSPQSIFKELIRIHEEEKLSFHNVIVFNLYEFYPLTSPAYSNLSYLKDYFLEHVDIKPENIYSPDGFLPKEEIYDFCLRYDQKIEEVGGIDYMLLGIGQAGNISFNSPGSSINSRTRLVLLDNDSRKEAAKIFKSIDSVPAGVVTMGMSTIMKAKEIVMMAWGDGKAHIVKETVEEKMSESIPATYLQTLNTVRVITDLSAAYQLTRISHPWLVTSCEWDNKLIRRAIVWLCQLTGKPILKLTNKDYSENGLGELLTKFGSAYEVNIKIFNDIQHTITGWPGGKYGADDSNRPERANPQHKRVIIFSPHPDDDVISMGGTFRRLCDQGHDVYVAYQTSGNIAVGDEEVIRYCEYLKDVSSKYSPNNDAIKKKAEEIIHFLKYEKVAGEAEKEDVLFMKGTIRREEARAGAQYSGIKQEDHIRFLDLPFYETGLVKKNELSEADIRIIRDFLEEVKPHQIFVAGDLADPHGTHKVCLDAALAAIDEVKDTQWMKECRIWMYRGAWAEWEMDHIEMAVPMSPEQLRQKRNAILKHQSQMESAPFLGDDERLFWQRAEDRNRATADLYKDLGLASYEAIEAFVQYIPLR
ncbi:glucosamine-6-phosphate deaminase [Parabacteroides sp. PF5-5]|uniref:glucosamine-6-phosphate deaminase n=1 Tax=unclassified Parabacteroides TaxID=2649774 RepID=UPI002473FBD0|nr:MULTISPECIES: glucosamine-6-phosphate deaminase [unclassified Parabacteroides]MDH6306508.1 glucosamine-6-phosphate deaminase [Parabacteroides sp. PH5-39]MDH6317475.1 glucosamine-6-phosphate deaminase [Parabacteroides sp. PF5-13]MDH6321222.1 glucosamine-6-phosphate deaminase [Parabacteroides sp. PH5-13]MDH6324954.1 glucosamine-6-phosphate deaminase [Parabacteroides sp. PH5-8]MDH6328663.1 glucosamine-6-phosphate deaminase [Parabacteroides sp. PH5-41]